MSRDRRLRRLASEGLAEAERGVRELERAVTTRPAQSAWRAPAPSWRPTSALLRSCSRWTEAHREVLRQPNVKRQ
jgi:hypothetical protein